MNTFIHPENICLESARILRPGDFAQYEVTKAIYVWTGALWKYYCSEKDSWACTWAHILHTKKNVEMCDAQEPSKSLAVELFKKSVEVLFPSPTNALEELKQELRSGIELAAIGTLPTKGLDMNKPTDVQSTLSTRANTHGDFIENGRIMQHLKDVVRGGANWNPLAKNSNPLTEYQREALDMICHKMGRILSGNPNEPDHWHDIAGYATLVENILKTGKSHPSPEELAAATLKGTKSEVISNNYPHSSEESL